MKTNDAHPPIGSGENSSQPNTKNRNIRPSAQDAPANQKYHDQSPLTRRLVVASAGKKDVSTNQRVPNFFLADPPVGAAILYLSLLVAGAYSGCILGALTSLSGIALLAVAAPVLIGALEFIVVPGIKYHSLRDKQVAMMKAFVAEDRAARDSATHAATAWNLKDWFILIILGFCFAAKAFVLVQFGAFQPQALLAANWTIALLDLSFHLAGTTTRVPCYFGSRLVDTLHLRRRRSHGYQEMGMDGKPLLGSLAFREFSFTTLVPLRTGEVNGHVIVHTESNAGGHNYTIFCPGTLDDSDRAAFLQCQRNNPAKDELARALARVQLELLTAPEMLVLNSEEVTSSSAVADDDRSRLQCESLSTIARLGDDSSETSDSNFTAA